MKLHIKSECIESLEIAGNTAEQNHYFSSQSTAKRSSAINYELAHMKKVKPEFMYCLKKELNGLQHNKVENILILAGHPEIIIVLITSGI